MASPRFFVYFASSNAYVGKRHGDAILFFVCFSWFVKIAYGVTSEPVPAVVGICIIGSALLPMLPSNKFFLSMSDTASNAMAFAESIGEPPPMAMTKSTSSSIAVSAPSYTHSTVGLLITLSNMTYSILFFSSAYLTSSSAPLNFADFLPVTISAFFPILKTSLFSLTQSFPTITFVGI